MNYSKITNQLYVGTTPRTRDYDTLRELGIRLVINMRFGFPPARDKGSPEMVTIWLPAIDSPLFPIPLRLLERGARAALEVINDGGVVYTHCSKGRHRGVAMGACILIASGMEAEEAMALVKQQRQVADPQAWYIRRRILRFAKEWGRIATDEHR